MSSAADALAPVCVLCCPVLSYAVLSCFFRTSKTRSRLSLRILFLFRWQSPATKRWWKARDAPYRVLLLSKIAFVGIQPSRHQKLGNQRINESLSRSPPKTRQSNPRSRVTGVEENKTAKQKLPQILAGFVSSVRTTARSIIRVVGGFLLASYSIEYIWSDPIRYVRIAAAAATVGVTNRGMNERDESIDNYDQSYYRCRQC